MQSSGAKLCNLPVLTVCLGHYTVRQQSEQGAHGPQLMALLDVSHPAHDERLYEYPIYGGQSGAQVSPAKLSGRFSGSSRDTGSDVRADMPTPLSGSTNSGSVVPPPGLPHSTSTAELVALGIISATGSTPDDVIIGVDSAEYNSSDSGGFDPRSAAPHLTSSGGGGSMVGSTNDGNAGLEQAGGGGTQNSPGDGGGGGVGDIGVDVVTNAGTGSAGGMGLGLRNHSLTNLANMVRSHSVSSFHSELFSASGGGGGGGAERMTTPGGPSWGSYPANLDKAGGGGGGSGGAHGFTVSPSMGSLGGPSRATAGIRSSPAGADAGGAEVSPPQFAGRGTAPRREVERGMPAWSSAARSSQRRPTGTTSMDHGGVPAGRMGGGMPSGRAMVHNRSDTDLVASFSRMGFGQGGISRWSPHMSPTASPLGGPLLEENPLDLELDENTHHELGGGDTFTVSLREMGQRGSGYSAAAATTTGARLPRHASYPSLALSHGGYGMEDLVQGAFEELNAGDNATGGSTDGGGGGGGGGGAGIEGAGSLAASGLSSSRLSASGMSSGSLSGSGGRVNGRINAGGSSSAVAGASGGSSSSIAAATAAHGGGYSPNATPGTATALTSSHTMNPATPTHRPAQGMRQTPPDGGRGSQSSRHRSHAHGGSGGGGAGGSAGGGNAGRGHRPNQYSYDQGRAGLGGIDGVMMSDGRFVPSSAIYSDGHPGMMYGDGGYGPGGGVGGYDNIGGGGGGQGMDAGQWGVNHDLSLYQALLMKQSLAAAHASGMRFPNVMPVANGMGIDMVDMALAAAAQAANAGRGAYIGGGNSGGGYGGHPAGGDMQGGYARRDGAQMRGSGAPRGGGMGGMDAGGYMGQMAGMPDARGGGMVGMGRGGGVMYDVVEDVGDGNVYQVQFKRATRNFLLGKTCQRDLQVKQNAGGGWDGACRSRMGFLSVPLNTFVALCTFVVMCHVMCRRDCFVVGLG